MVDCLLAFMRFHADSMVLAELRHIRAQAYVCEPENVGVLWARLETLVERVDAKGVAVTWDETARMIVTDARTGTATHGM